MTNSILNIIAMNWALGEMEQIKEAQMKADKPASKEPIHYWNVYRKAQGRRKQKLMASFFCTKREMAEKWNKFYRTGEFRLIHEVEYPTR